jgi:rod shape-determining protein MreD
MIRVLHRIDVIARQSVPFALALLLVLMSALPATLPVFRQAAPWWVLIAVFYWSVYRPDLMPVQAAFVLGLLQDFLIGTPPGVSALLYVVLRGCAGVIARHVTGRSFLKVWVLFAIVAASAVIARHLIMILWYEQLVDPGLAVVQLLLTVGVYPLAGWALARLQKGLLAHV